MRKGTQMDREAARDKLLLATLPHVAFDGWCGAALAAGAADAGMAESDVQRFFPGGAGDMVAHFSAWADASMTDGLAGRDLTGMRTRARVALALRLRLEAVAPWRETVRRTLAWLALPGNAPLGLRCAWRSVDAVWYALGDNSADFSFYTRRALLAGVLSATALYWLEDDSEGCSETWAFLDRRIDDALSLPALGARARRLASRLPDPFRILRAARAGGR